MKLVFCGTPEFAVPTLEKLHAAGHAVRLVITQPDRPRGRGLTLAESPVKQKALELGLQVVQPETIKNNEEFRTRLAALQPDAIIVVGYGRIIPSWMIDLPRLGNINLHASLLPKYRGAAPIQWAIARGENLTGVTTMRIDAGLDTGDILLQKEVPIRHDDTAITLASRLAALGADLMVQTIQEMDSGTIHPRPQDHSQATLAPILNKEDGQIDFELPAQEICNRIRGFQPWPGVFTNFRGRKLHLWNATAATEKPVPPSGELLIEAGTLLVGCGRGQVLAVKEVQPEGKKRMKVHEFIQGYRPRNGEKLETPHAEPLE
ncbi:MAG: methionyl-tRNA formyltransferase [Acidobacteriales bacterium]|nr:methionyl-tRNA formyltransferase [Terriglobales bacterium]